MVRTILRTLNFEVKEQVEGLKLAFSIKKDEKKVQFYLHNLLLEIATVDRDKEPPRFDENLRNFDYFLAKMARVTESKLNVLSHLLGQDDVDSAIENIAQDAKQYERIHIWRFDQTDTDEKVR